MASKVAVDLPPSAPPIELVWAFGGLYRIPGGRPLGWTYDGAVNAKNLGRGFDRTKTAGNTVTVHPSNGTFRVALANGNPTASAPAASTVGRVSDFDTLAVVNVSSLFPPSPPPPKIAPDSGVDTAGAAPLPPPALQRSLDAVASGCAADAAADADADPDEVAAAGPSLDGLLGWFKAEDLQRGKVSRWPNSAPAAAGGAARDASNDVVQPVVAAQPARTTVSFGAGGNDSAMPAVEFDGVGTFLAGDMVLPPEKTIMVVLVVGSKADVCCSGVAIVWSAGVLT